MHIIQLGDEAAPYPGVTGDCQWFVGRSARVCDAAFALIFDERSQAERIAARFPLAQVHALGQHGLQARRLSALLLAFSPSPEDFERLRGLPAAELSALIQSWAPLLFRPDDRCPSTGTRYYQKAGVTQGQDRFILSSLQLGSPHA